MKISASGYSEDWAALELDDPESADWDMAIEIFRGRIENRFIGPVNALIEFERKQDRDQRRCGFIIMAIDCLLIETLQAFRWGKLASEHNPVSPPPLLKTFLQKSPRFDWDPWMAERFKLQIRNGILHQAETLGDSLIRSEGPLVLGEESDNGLVINRTEFHRQVEIAFEDYIKDLKKPHMSVLRANFRRKMNDICRRNPLSEKYPIGES